MKNMAAWILSCICLFMVIFQIRKINKAMERLRERMNYFDNDLAETEKQVHKHDRKLNELLKGLGLETK